MNRLRTMTWTRKRELALCSAALSLIVGACYMSPARGDETATAPKSESDSTSLAVRQAELAVRMAEARVEEAQGRLDLAKKRAVDGKSGELATELASEITGLQADLAQAKMGQAYAEEHLKSVIEAEQRAAAVATATSMRILRLQHARAEAVAEMLKQVYGDRLRMAVDQPSNTLIVLSQPDILAATEQLVTTLDAAPENAPPGPEAERTLQLRILWLMDGPNDETAVEPDERYVSPAVVDTLHGLGLEHPKVMCQHVTTLATSRDSQTEFAFEIPTRAVQSSVDFSGAGRLSSGGTDRYRVELQIKLEPYGGQECRVTGSLVTPLDHYVVLGTTNYFDQDDRRLDSALVVFLQEAPITAR